MRDARLALRAPRSAGNQSRIELLDHAGEEDRMRNEQELTPGRRTSGVHVFSATSQPTLGLTLFVRRYPITSLCAAGTLGFAFAWLQSTGARSLPFASLRAARRRLTAADGESTRAWRTGDSPKAHGDKFASAARAAATRTRAPTYPEG